MSVINTHRFGQFWPISWTITHYFGVLERFPRLTNPGVRLRFGHQHSRFLSILTRFMDYYSPFWGLGVISMFDEHRGAFMCRSSTLAVLADSGPFRGVLRTLLRYRSDFNDSRTAGCVYVSVINTYTFVRFSPFLYTITHCFGVPE